MECEYCGRKESEDNKIWFIADPFESDVNGDYTEHYICDECYENKSDEI